ncbi:MAG: transcriptional regulator [Planctomycetes bacterium]|nr:transcriptional regulator [Planctomycetota bacterium]
MAKKRTESERRLRQSCRFARVLRLLNLVQGQGGPWTPQSAATELECSERTVFRDIEVLRLAGVPIVFEQDTGYRLLADARFPVPALTSDEAIGQAVAAVVADTPNLKPGLGATPVTRKLAAAAPETTRRLLGDASGLVAVLDMKLADHAQHQDAIRVVQRSLLAHTKLAGSYRSPHEPQPTEVILHPYRLCFLKQAWYVVGRPEGGDHPQTYRVHRFDPNLRQLPDPADVPEDFDLRTYFGNAWSVYRGEPSYEVEIIFNQTAANVVLETVWHRTQQAHRHPDGSVTLRFTIDGLTEIVRWVLGWSGSCRVLRPPELRDLVVARLRAGLEPGGTS